MLMTRHYPDLGNASDWLNIYFNQSIQNYCSQDLGSDALSSAEAPAGYPHQNINNRKNRKRAGDDRAPRALCARSSDKIRMKWGPISRGITWNKTHEVLTSDFDTI